MPTPSSNARAVIFDLDGTLVDSNRDLVPTLNRVVAIDGVPPTSLEDVGHIVGQGAMAMIARAFALHGVPLEHARHKELLALYLNDYERHLANETVFFDGALEALDLLAADGWQLHVCTNKYEHLARKLLNALGESARFGTITGGDTFAVKKPDPGHLIETARLANVDPSRCIMIGDSINDIAAAQAANMPVVAVTFGYSDVPVQTLGPDAIISHFSDLPAAIKAVSQADPRFS
ncbi:MAG: phosphoglycolate phosphatase [Pseudomonadota bacterium]